MYGFFLRTEKPLCLLMNRAPLAHRPMVCSDGIERRPDIVPRTRRVALCSTNPSYTTLFIPMAEHEGQPSTYTPASLDGTFCLVCYPDPSRHTDDVLDQEYVSAGIPMALCRGIGDYYLGAMSDANKLFFKVSPRKNGSWMTLADDDTYDPALSYGSPTFSGTRVYVSRVMKTG